MIERLRPPAEEVARRVRDAMQQAGYFETLACVRPNFPKHIRWYWISDDVADTFVRVGAVPPWSDVQEVADVLIYNGLRVYDGSAWMSGTLVVRGDEREAESWLTLVAPIYL